MKCLKVLSLVIILAFSSAIIAQEKETEKSKEAEKAKEVEKTKENSSDKSHVNPNNNFQFWTTRSRTHQIPNKIPDVSDVGLVIDSFVENSNIEVTTKAKDEDGDVLTYNYTVSGGKIIGQGEKVIWDLSGVKPGTYTITAAVDDGCGFCGKMQTKTVIVKE